MRKILIVSYHFPPDASVGGMRPAKFAKYLPKFGWEPLVLTVQERYHPLTDQSKLTDLDPTLRVYRTRMLPQPGRLYLALKRGNRTPTPAPPGPSVTPSSTNHRGVLSSIKRALGSVECLPDDKQIWIPMAVPAAAKLIHQHKIDAVLTTGPPMSCHVIGLMLKAMTGRRWVADFRDPWLLDSRHSQRDSNIPSTAFSRKAEAWLERKTMRKADSVVFTTDRMQAYLHQRYPFLTNKSAVILNGYDPSDFNGGEPPTLVAPIKAPSP